MTSRQARRERREAERKAAKLARKAGLDPASGIGFVSQTRPEPTPHHDSPETIVGFVSKSAPVTSRRTEINRQNARHSTGPRSCQGKLASSRNSLKHGLSTGQVIIPGEDPAAFEALRDDLLREHQPANSTEDLLVLELAQSHWLMQRAIRLQNECFTEHGIDEKRLSLFLRYQTTHERRFHKALSTLIRLQKERRKSEAGFVSQRPSNLIASEAGEPGFVWQNEADSRPHSGFVSQNASQALAEAA